MKNYGYIGDVSTTLVPAQSIHKQACKHIVHCPSNNDKAPLGHIQNTYAISHIHRQCAPCTVRHKQASMFPSNHILTY
jgi:hypothetical protein